MVSKNYIPDRNDIIFLDFEPTKGKEIGKYRPAFTLTSKEYNKKTGLLICCPISTSVRGAAIEVPINNIDRPSVVVASMVHTLSWKNRKAKFITKAEKYVFADVLQRLLPIIGAAEIF